ncbi:MBL fold metallo-hydrolase [Streptomyces sp. MS1.HAVA.3]|uniref:MBL fold metallo-hydrolase n=1 Tax=Streptomyces caledonius TaxID=3134107 RepID=A0ABU8UB13_9ACTN
MRSTRRTGLDPPRGPLHDERPGEGPRPLHRDAPHGRADRGGARRRPRADRRRRPEVGRNGLLRGACAGHTKGSVTFRMPELADIPPVFFSGDLLFAGSIGRTDLPGGSHAEMLESLARVCLPLDDSTVVLSGHGPQTTIGRERATNPYLREVAAGLAATPDEGAPAPRRGM